MKKIVLSLILCMTLLSAFAFAEEAPSLESQIQELEATIVELKAALSVETITQADYDTLALQLEDSEIALAVLLEQHEQIQNAQEEKALLSEITRLIAEHEALQKIDTTTMTAEELEAHQVTLQEAFDKIQVAKKAYQDFVGPTQEELKTALQADAENLKAEILALETSLDDESLTEEERLAIQTLLEGLNADLEAVEIQLADIATLEQAEAIADLKEALLSLETELNAKRAALESEDLTEEEKTALVESIEALENNIEAIQKELNAIEESIKEENPNFKRFLMAEELNITPGKMNLLEKLGQAAKDEAFDYALWSEKSVKDIMAEIKVYRKNSDHEEIQVEDKSFEENTAKSNNGKANGKKK